MQKVWLEGRHWHVSSYVDKEPCIIQRPVFGSLKLALNKFELKSFVQHLWCWSRLGCLCFILCALISIDKDEGLCESLITHPFMYYHFRDKTCLCTSGLQQQEYSGKAGWHLCFGRFWVCNEGTWCCKTSRWWDSNNWGMADSTIWPVARVHNCFLQCRQTLGVEKTTISRLPWKQSIKDFFLFLKLGCYEGEGICTKIAFLGNNKYPQMDIS